MITNKKTCARRRSRPSCGVVAFQLCRIWPNMFVANYHYQRLVFVAQYHVWDNIKLYETHSLPKRSMTNVVCKCTEFSKYGLIPQWRLSLTIPKRYSNISLYDVCYCFFESAIFFNNLHSCWFYIIWFCAVRMDVCCVHVCCVSCMYSLLSLIQIMFSAFVSSKQLIELLNRIVWRVN